MRRNLTACGMCFSMFCSLPSPFHKWEEEARPQILLFLPLVGLWIGLLWMGLAYVLSYLKIPALVSGAFLCSYPFVITGFIHLDGFLDVTDAVKSWRDLTERRRILKDPHTGSFATIACGLLMMIQFSFLATGVRDFRIFIFLPVISRCLSSLAVTILKPMETSEYAGSFRNGIRKSHVVLLLLQLFVTLAVATAVLGMRGLLVCICVMIGYGLSLRRACKSLEGMSGDVSGYALTIGELCGIGASLIL